MKLFRNPFAFAGLYTIVGIFLFLPSFTSCAKNGCTVRNTQTGEIAADNNCNGIPDFQENIGTGVGNITFYGEGLITNVASTNMAYYNDGNGFAIMDGGHPMEQWRLISFKIWNGSAFVVREAVINMNLANKLKTASGEIGITNTVIDFFDRKDVSAFQQYMNNDEKVLVPQFAAVPESNPIWSSIGSNTCDPMTGKLNGRRIHYEIIGWEAKKVNQVFRF